MRRPHRVLAAALAGGTVLSPTPVQAKPAHQFVHKKSVMHKNAEAARKACQPYHEQIKAAEKRKKLPRHLGTALLFTESRCKPKAEHKRTRARGVAQFTPSGAAAVRRILGTRGETPWFRHSDAFDPIKSIRAAAELLAYGLETCGSLSEAIGAYNTGHCTTNRFSRAVLRLAAAIRFIAGEEPTS